MGSRAITEPLALTTDYVSLDGRYTDENGNPYASVAAAEAALGRRINQYTVGLKVLVKESGWDKAKEYWVQPDGNGGFGLEKCAQEDIASMDDVQPINAALNDRVALRAEVDGVSKLRSMGYKVLKASVEGDASTSFQRQLAPIVDGTAQPITNTVFEVKDYFDLGNETFTMPSNSKLKIEGGKIDNGTLNLNNCQIEATDGWIGENLIISGKPSSDVYADWFQGSNADKIERAIQLFSVVHLYPKRYSIDRPIVIGNNFGLIGSSIGDFNGTTNGNIINGTTTELYPSTTIDCLLDIRGSYADQSSQAHPIHTQRVSTTKARIVSASITNVAFIGNSARNVDGIWWSTPNGPSRPINFVGCTFKSLRHGIDIFQDNETSGNGTNFGDSYFQQCVFTSNHWGIYAEGYLSVSNMVFSSCVMEDNHTDDLVNNKYVDGGGIYSNSDNAFWGNLRIINSIFEGQSYGVVIKGNDLNVEFSGNYFEYVGGQTNILKNSNTNETRKAKCVIDIDVVTHASKTNFSIEGFEIEHRLYSGAASSVNYFYKNSILRSVLAFKSTIKPLENNAWIAVPATDEFLENTAIRESDLICSYNKTPDYVIDGIDEPFFNTDDSSFSGLFCGRHVLAGRYIAVFYCKGGGSLLIAKNKKIHNYDDQYDSTIIIPYTDLVLVNLCLELDTDCSLRFILRNNSGKISKISLFKVSTTYSKIISFPIKGIGRRLPTSDIVNLPISDKLIQNSGFTVANTKDDRTCFNTSINQKVSLKSIVQKSSVIDQYSRSTSQTSISTLANPFTEDTEAYFKIIQIGTEDGSYIPDPRIYFYKFEEVTTEPSSWSESFTSYYYYDSSTASYTKFSGSTAPSFGNQTVYNRVIALTIRPVTHNKAGGSSARADVFASVFGKSTCPQIGVTRGEATSAAAAAIFYFYAVTSKSTSYIIPLTGVTSNRPTLTAQDAGVEFYDTTLKKPIYWNGTIWTDANGEPLELGVSDTTVLIGAAADSTKDVSIYYGGSTAPTITLLNADDTANTWLTATPDPFTGNTLTLTASANESSAPRGAKVLVTLGDELVIINVVQSY